MRRRRGRAEPASPFKVPDGDDIFLQSREEKAQQQKEMRMFLPLPIAEKTTRTTPPVARQRRELLEQLHEEESEEAKEKMKHLKHTEAPLCERTLQRHGLKMAMLRREGVMKDRKHDLISMERQKAVLEISLVTTRSEIEKIDKAIAKEEKQLRQLEKAIERDNLKFEGFLRENEKKSVETRTFLEQEAKTKQENNAVIRKLTSQIGTIKSEILVFEETLKDYKRYKDLLFNLSPPEWQEAQRAKSSHKVHLRRPGEGQAAAEEQAGLQEAASGPGLEPPLLRDNASDDSEYEDEPQLFFTDPQQLLDLMTELTEQNLSLIQNSTRVEERLDELRQSMESTRRKIAKDEEQQTLQMTEMNQRIQREKERAAKLRQKVQLHLSLNTEDQDGMLDALGEKVAEVHRCCVDDRVSGLSTLEKLASIESHLSSLLQNLEKIPEDRLDLMQKIKDSERRTRQREEKLREQKEKQRERMRRYMERSMDDTKRASGRKLLPRSTPAPQKVKVEKVESIPVEDELHAYLFTADDTD